MMLAGQEEILVRSPENMQAYSPEIAFMDQ
jgi:hypothetical protein